MSLLLNCQTDFAVLLCAVPDERGVLHFPSNDSTLLPGLNFTVAGLTPINEQLIKEAEGFFGKRLGNSLQITQEFADPVPRPDGVMATLYLATVAQGSVTFDPSWRSLPEILRGLPKNKGRVPFLRAWQILSGGLQLDTKAVDMAEVAKHFDD